MATSISKQRKALKEELTVGNKKTMVDVLLHWVSRGRQTSTWSGILLAFFVTLILSIILGLISGNTNPIYKAGFEVPPFWVAWSIFNLFTCTASMVISNLFFHRMVSLMQDQVIDKVNSPKTLSDIHSWIDAVSNKSPAAVSIVLLGGLMTSVAMAS